MNIMDALAKNAPNSDLFGTDQICIFEIGKVFDADGERDVLILGVQSKQGFVAKKDTKTLESGLEAVRKILGSFKEYQPRDSQSAIVWTDLTHTIESLPLPAAYTKHEKSPDIIYKPFSMYPYVTRDIALLTPAGTTAEDVQKVIYDTAGRNLVRLSDSIEVRQEVDNSNSKVWLVHQVSGSIATTASVTLFDKYEKDGKSSFAYHLVFQSYEKTLTAPEVDAVMQTISSAVSAKGFEVR